MVPMAVMCMQQMMDTVTAGRTGPAPSSSRRGATVANAYPSRGVVAVGDEIRRCLQDFLAEHNIDLVPFLESLSVHDFTPDIIPHLSTARLLGVFDGVAEGSVVKFQLFAKEWNTWLGQARV